MDYAAHSLVEWLYFKIRGTKEDPIPNVIKLELTYIPVEFWIIYPYVD